MDQIQDGVFHLIIKENVVLVTLKSSYHCTSLHVAKTITNLVLFRDFLLPRPENGPGTQAGKERVLYYLQVHARNDAIFSPKTGGKTIFGKKDSLFGHSLFRVLLHWIHGDNVKGNYNAKFLEAIDFVFKKFHFTFVPKAEQPQVIHAVITGNDGFVKPATGFGKSVCYMVVPYMFAISSM